MNRQCVPPGAGGGHAGGTVATVRCGAGFALEAPVAGGGGMTVHEAASVLHRHQKIKSNTTVDADPEACAG